MYKNGEGSSQDDSKEKLQTKGCATALEQLVNTEAGRQKVLGGSLQENGTEKLPDP